MLDEPRRYDEPERLTEAQRAELQEKLTAIGPWVYSVGTGGLHVAQRLGTDKQEQASLTTSGLLSAVEQREAQLGGRTPVPVQTGLISRR
jgi:hypothetical protein